jgi:hypothetical protein
MMQSRLDRGTRGQRGRCERINERVPLDMPVQYQHNGRIHAGIGADISSGGLKMRAKQMRVRCGEKIKLFFPLRRSTGTRSQLCMATGIVVWRDGSSVGIRFHDPAESVQLLINEYVNRHTKVWI